MKLSNLFKRKVQTTGNRIVDFYSKYDEDGRFVRKSRMPEFLITMQFIEKYLFSGAKIIEIGAGTGRYSFALAEKGYEVTAVDLTPAHVMQMQKKKKEHHNMHIYEANACDLSRFADASFDIVLLLGPMYHLFTDEDKHSALREALRICKEGGIVFVSYCNNDTTMYKYFHNGKILEYLDKGAILDDYHAKSIPEEVFELYRKSDIDALMRNYNVTRLHFVGVDMLSYLFDDSFDRMSDRLFDEYMKFLSVLCEREDSTGLSIHMLDIFRKEKEQ